VNSPWLQNGYKKFRNAADCPDWADYLDKKRIKSADNYGLDRSESRVGVMKMSFRTPIYPQIRNLDHPPTVRSRRQI
jgi:hypothetical protein